MFEPLTSEEKAAAGDPVATARPTKTPIVPVPSDAVPMKFKHPRYGEPTKSWAYHDAEGRLVGYVARWDVVDTDGNPDKEILPITFCDLGDGRRGWRSKGILSPRPLLGLPDILARADAPILVAEGEKTRDAAAVLFPDVVATTPAHGAKSPHLTDFGPCAGRTVIIATDYDEPGRVNDKGRPLHPGQDFGDKVCELARAAGATAVLHLLPDRLGAWVWSDGEKVLRDEPMADGWDLADALAENWTAERITEMRDDPGFLRPYVDASERRAELGEDASDEDDDSPGWFRLTAFGVEKKIERADKETGVITVEWRWFCSLLEVAAETRNRDGQEWGRLLIVMDRDDASKSWAMPMSMLAGDGTAYRERLLSMGLIMAPGRFGRDALHEYISTARPESKARCVGTFGWHWKMFVTKDESFEV